MPAIGQPQVRSLVAAVIDELRPVAGGDQSVREPERFDEHVMAGLFVVERERVAAVPSLDYAAVDVDPSGRAVGPTQRLGSAL